MLRRFERGDAFNLYRESVSELLSPYRTSGHFRDLPHQAYEARAASKQRRIGLAHTVASRLLNDDFGHAQSRLYEAEALHIVSIPLSSEMNPTELTALLQPCAIRLRELRRQNPELGRYCGLIERTVSMAASKLDLYTAAFDRINRAHLALSDAPDNRRTMTREEALQQLYLQECGQLARNVEAGLIEQDPVLRIQLQSGQPPTKTLKSQLDLRSLRIVARASAEAGARACRLLDAIAAEVGLPSSPDPEQRRLATSSWFLTSNIMYIRALLLAATVELATGHTANHYLRPIPDLYARVVQAPSDPGIGANTPPLRSHLLDLTRIALHWSFLSQGNHPYPSQTLAFSFGLRPGIPAHLSEAVGGRLDTTACTAFLTENSHDAGILNVLAHVETFMLFTERGGTGVYSYLWWLDHQRPRNNTLTADDARLDHDISRKTRRPTHGLISRSAKMVTRSGRYREVLCDV